MCDAQFGCLTSVVPSTISAEEEFHSGLQSIMIPNVALEESKCTTA